ncbi:MAG: cbb3-type cytochrome c oxidase subunit I [Sphingobacteriaceae bacterium]|nr:cbb3-type cytochrome c oxidase subunit I [Sphingobacteriaceae bacterium]
MKLNKFNIGNLFLITSLCLLALGLSFGLLATLIYIFPEFLKDHLGFVSLRPLHVSLAIFWIILGATGCIYNGLKQHTTEGSTYKIAIVQWILWITSIIGIAVSYFIKDFGGREYWEFNPIWAFPIALAWVLFLVNFYSLVKKIKNWPVYIWMWLTGVLFFLFTFTENYLWVFPYFREHFITDMTIQWKVNGSLVGAWNQILYGTAIFLMDRISNTKNTGRSKLAFAMYFLGITNLMFNWGHHIYTLPTEKYIRYFGYAVSMTEWIFLVKIFFDWKKSLTTIQKNYHYFPYRFLMAADIWVLLNLFQAILMSIPAINKFTHGTHVTVAHAMGTTIGINSMILFAACFIFFDYKLDTTSLNGRFLNKVFWLIQGALFLFWLSLNFAGIKKGIWQLSDQQSTYSEMMESLQPYFITFFCAGSLLFIGMCLLVYKLLIFARSNKIITTNN